MVNPFDSVMPLEKGPFLPRQRELDAVVSYLSKPRPHSVQIVGPTRVGKSTFLHQLLSMKFESTLSKIVRLDCATLPKQDSATLFSAIMRQVSQVVPGIEDPTDIASVPLADLRRTLVRVFAALDSRDTRLAVVLDHFDHTVIGLQEDDLGCLRAVINAYRHALVTVTNDHLANLTANVRQSTLSELCAPVVLGLVPPQLALDTIQGVFHESALRLTYSDQEFLANYAGFHPAVLQRACYLLFEEKQQRAQLVAADYSRLKHQLDQDVHPLLASMIEPLTARQRRVLYDISRLEPVPSTERHVIDVLRHRHKLLGESGAVDRVFGEVLVHFMQRVHPLSGRVDQLDGLETVQSLFDDLGLAGTVLSDASLHLKDAMRLIRNSDWTSANASIRDVYQAVVDWLANELRRVSDPAFTDHASKLQLLQNRGFLSPQERAFLQKFWALASTNGPHPGRSDAPATLLRFHSLLGILTHLLVDYGRHVGLLT